MSSSPDRQTPILVEDLMEDLMESKEQFPGTFYVTTLDGKIIFNWSDSDDDEYTPKPCFEINPNVKEKEVPSNGEEYLLKVIKERENYPAVTGCNFDIYLPNEESSSVPTEEENPKKPKIPKKQPEVQSKNEATSLSKVGSATRK